MRLSLCGCRLAPKLCRLPWAAGRGLQRRELRGIGQPAVGPHFIPVTALYKYLLQFFY